MSTRAVSQSLRLSIQGTLFCALKLALNSTTHRPDLQICSSSTARKIGRQASRANGADRVDIRFILHHLEFVYFLPRFS